MKLKLWVEVILLILASICVLLIFTEPFILNWIGIVGCLVIAIPLAKYGRLNDIERRK